jgi:hypothetical protein
MNLIAIQSKIFEIRGQKVMLDFDLAELYEIETKVLKRQVRRNLDRFPPDFMFVLTSEEYKILRSQFGTLRLHGQHAKYAPFAFTEQGVAMLSSVVNSAKAIEMNISIMRAFVMMRQYFLEHKELAEKIGALERKYNKQFKDIYEALDLLLNDKQTEEDWKNRKQIGYKKA